MTIVKRIVCLANSRKLSGRCVAGKEFSSATWIRPVSARPSEEVSEEERQYEDGSDPRLLDVIDVPLIQPRPKGYQQENWLLEPMQYWKRIGQLSWAQLAKFEDGQSGLWLNGDSTYHGLNDQIPIAAAATISSSLRLILVQKITLRVFVPGAKFGDPKRRVQGQFKYAGDDYWFRVTDPAIERTYKAREDGIYELGESYLTISLGEPFNGYTYKLIAAIILKS